MGSMDEGGVNTHTFFFFLLFGVVQALSDLGQGTAPVSFGLLHDIKANILVNVKINIACNKFSTLSEF